MASGMAGAKKHDAKYEGVRNFWGDPEKNKLAEAKRKRWLAKAAEPLLDRTCKNCGCPLHFARTNDGKTIPLDLRAHIYSIVYERTEPRQPATVVRTELCYVSHFFTCPDANLFSGSKRSAELK